MKKLSNTFTPIQILEFLNEIRNKELYPADRYHVIADLIIMKHLEYNNIFSAEEKDILIERLNAIKSENGVTTVKNTTTFTGPIIGSVITSGDKNQINANLTFGDIALPPPETVDITSALKALEEAISSLNLPERGRVERAFADARDETAKSKPDKADVGSTLERIGTYAKKAADFTDNGEKIAKAAAPVVAWLGTAGVTLGRMFGLG